VAWLSHDPGVTGNIASTVIAGLTLVALDVVWAFKLDRRALRYRIR
jgi:hypothetical protein